MAEEKKAKETKVTAAKAKKPAQPEAAPAKKAPAKKKSAAKPKQSAAKPKAATVKTDSGNGQVEAAPKKSKAKAEISGPRLKRFYHEKVISSLQSSRGYKNVWQVPRLEKIVLNIGLGNAREDAKVLQGALDDLATITGQKAVITYAKKPISNFKIRLKDPVGAKVTLRKDHMWEFFDRLMALAIPRVRDFRGLPNKSFDGRGNYSMGLTEQIVFPEIDYDKIDQIRGMDVTFVTTARTDEESYDLLRSFGFPFRPKPQANQEGSAA